MGIQLKPLTVITTKNNKLEMAEEEVATPAEAPAVEEAAPAKKAAKPKKEKKAAAAPKAKKAAAPAAHPKYSVMIAAAIEALKDRTGSSRQAILKYICANYTVDAKKAATQLRLSLKRGVAAGSLKMAKEKGKGAGYYKLAEKVKTPKAKKAPKAKTAKKPVAKKA